MTSWALWIPLVWIAIIGSRPISAWFGAEVEIRAPADYIEGSPLDRNVFMILLILGLLALWKRKIDWTRVFAANRWVFVFFLYGGISIVWSDYPLVSLKRWVKDLGNVVMIIIILTEKDAIRAMAAVFLRYAYLVIIFSVLFIRYLPDLGRYYDPWTWEAFFGGVAGNKNELGCAVLVSGLFLVWDWIERQRAGSGVDKLDLASRFLLLLMSLWLIHVAQSSTALLALIIGAGIVVLMRFSGARMQVNHLGKYGLGIGLVLILVFSTSDGAGWVLETLGKDITLTGRTELWSELLREPVNSLVGAGYDSFWLGASAERIWRMFYFHPTQAHNGFLETYLNGGYIGLCLLLGMIVSTGIKAQKEIVRTQGYPIGILRLAALVVVILYAWTEALFSKPALIWILFLLSAISYPPASFTRGLASRQG